MIGTVRLQHPRLPFARLNADWLENGPKSRVTGGSPVAVISDWPHNTGMTQTLYRPIGTTEVALIAKDGWTAFPPMPEDFSFYAYSQPVGDPREWPGQVNDIEFFEVLEYGQAEVVRSWQAWGNATDEYFIVWFEVDERLSPRLSARLNVDAVNRALIGKIEICARYGPQDIWIDPRLNSPG